MLLCFFCIQENTELLYVDGKEAEIKLIFDAFIGVEVTEGEHEIEMLYSPWHVYLAGILSLLGMSIFGVICISEGKKYNKVESLRENRGEKASLFQGEK